MLVFVDESGDLGRKQRPGSSRYYVVACVVFNDLSEAQRADDEISRLAAELQLGRAEFRFNKLASARRLRFLRRMAEFSFRYHALVVDKTRLSPDWQLDTVDLVSRLLAQAAPPVDRATVVIDGQGSRKYRARVRGNLKRHANLEREIVSKVRLEESHRNRLLQLADMVAGSVARSYRGQSDASIYRGSIRRREGVVLDDESKSPQS